MTRKARIFAGIILTPYHLQLIPIKMKQLTFRNGDTLDILGLGTWKSKPGEVGQAIRSAIKIGYRHFDCAFIYMNEREIGQAFADAFEDGDVKREDVCSSKELCVLN